MVAGLPAAAASLAGIGRDQSWQDRVREGAYTSPTGTRITYEFEDLAREYELRGTAFEFTNVNNTYVQRKGFGPRKYPMHCYFSGRDHDLVALAFEAALCEEGIGKLEHPFYSGDSGLSNGRGRAFDVVPFGSVTRRDDLKSAANQSVIEVTFWTTLREVYPRDAKNPESEITAAIGDFDVVTEQELAKMARLENAVNRANAKATVKSFLRDVHDALQSASDATAAVHREFDDKYRLVNGGIDVLIGQPLLLARQITDLIQTPARALSGIRSRLEGYAALLDRILASPGANPAAALSPLGSPLSSSRDKVANDFAFAYLFASAAVSGSVLAAVNNTFETKPEVLAATDDVLTQFDELVEWSDASFPAAGLLDTGEMYQALQQAVAITTGFLIQVSFTAVAERRIVLDRNRTIIDLTAELYGSVDDRLNLLINSNNLTGSEILELPAGKLIVYYPGT